MSDLCPKCAKPRLQGALDCPYCGIVYARFKPGPVAPPPAAAPSAAAGDLGESLDEVYRGGADEAGLYAGPAANDEGLAEPSPAPEEDMYQGQPAGDGVVSVFERRESEPGTRLGRVLVGNVYLAILGVGLLYLFVTFLWNTRFVVVTEGYDNASVAFFRTSGLQPPEGLQEAGSLRFIGRNWVWFGRPAGGFPELVLLHHRGGLARQLSGEEMAIQLVGWLEELGLEARSVDDREELLGGFEGQLVDVETLAVGGSGRSQGSLAVVPFTAKDGRPALLVLAAPRQEFDALYRQYLD